MPLSVDPARFTEPLSPEEPCGPDLDAEGDLDFLNRVAQVESLLPASFFSRDDEGRQQPFDRSGIDFKRESQGLVALLERTRDLRLLVLLARLAILDRDLAGFAGLLSAIAALLDAEWEAVHPRGEDGGYELRTAILQALDDMATVILPLQHLPLVQSRRHGAISFRSVMTADGEVQAREGETALDRGSIERALDEAEPDQMQALRAPLAEAASALGRIGAVTQARGGYGNAVELERLGLLVGRIRGLLDRGAAPAGGAAQADAEAPQPGAPAQVPPAAIACARQADAALAAASAYLRAHEPSSPAEVLVRQARMLVGKPFLEVMRILVPAHAQEAVLAIGSGRGLRLTFDQLAAVPEDDPPGEEDRAESRDEARSAVPAEPEAASEPASQAASVPEDSSDGNLEAEGAPDPADAPEAEPVEPEPAEPPAVPTPAPEPPRAPVFRAATRGEAIALLREAATYFRGREPSSPIPLLLDKAVAIADRDFLAILRDVLPELNAE